MADPAKPAGIGGAADVTAGASSSSPSGPPASSGIGAGASAAGGTQALTSVDGWASFTRALARHLPGDLAHSQAQVQAARRRLLSRS